MLLKNKAVACILVLALMMSMIPFTTFAADEVGSKIFYSNDFNDAAKELKTGGAVVAKSNSITREQDSSGNGFVRIGMANPVTEDCYFEATIKEPTRYMITEISLSANKLGATGNLQFKDAERKESALLKFTEDGNVTSYGSGKVLGKLTKGKWLSIAIVKDLQAKTYTTYVDGKQVEKDIKLGGTASENMVLMRLYLSKAGDGADILMDNFRVYEGKTPATGFSSLAKLDALSVSTTTSSAPASAVPSATPAAGEVGKKIFFNSDFNDASKAINIGGAYYEKGNSIKHMEDSVGNGYVQITMKDPLENDCYFEASIKDAARYMVTEISLSAEKVGIVASLQFKDADKKQGFLLDIKENGDVVSKASGKVLGKLTKGKWLNVAFAHDIQGRTYSAYVDGKQVEKDVKMNTDCSANINVMRLYLNKAGAGADVMFDNFRIYEGKEPRDVSKEAVTNQGATVGGATSSSTLAKIEPTPAPSLEKLDNGVALLVGNSNAYAKKDLTKVDKTNNEVSPVVIDGRTLVPVRFISESFDATVGWDEGTQTVSVKLGDKAITLKLDSNIMDINGETKTLDVPAQTIQSRTVIPLRALVEALGKNVFWDDRGLILITYSAVTIDAAKDNKLVGVILGYLKTGTKALNYTGLPKLTQEVIDEAAAQIPVYFNTTSNVGWNSQEVKGAKALYYLTLATLIDENTKATDGTLTKDRALVQLRNLISGGKEPFACSGPYWSHAVIAADLVLIKNTPAIYNAMTQDEKDKMDWLMKALAITGNWSFNDKNNYKTGPDLAGNFDKEWNPNYRCTYLSVVLSASMYFGGADAVNKLFTSFSYDEYMKKFEEYGFTNISKTWAIAGKDLMEKGGACTIKSGATGGTGVGVKEPFVYKGMPLSDLFGIFDNLMRYTYGANVINEGGTKGQPNYAYIISGASSPFTGNPGMMLEFKSNDAGGIRSDASYCYESMLIVMPFYTNLKMFGGWDSSTDKQKEVDALIYVGTEDLIFKLKEGYASHSKGVSNKHYEYNMNSKGYFMDKDIWRTVHQFETVPTTIAANPSPAATTAPLQAAPVAEPKDGISAAPANALKPALNSSIFPKEAFITLPSKFTGEVTTEFDLVFDPNVDETFDGVVAYANADAKDLTFAKTNVLIQFASGTINVRNGGSYASSALRIAPNYRYHFKVKINVATKKYSVWVTPTYPTQGTEVLIADNFDFRTNANAIEDIGSLILVTQVETGSYWIENHVAK